MLSIFLILVGIFINGIGTLNYVIQTIKGKIKPNKITFFVWSLAPFVVFLAQINKGVGIQSWMTLSVCIFPLSVLVASFVNKNAHWKLYKRDLLCGLLSILGLILWYFTKEANIALLFSIVSEGLGTLPIIIKAYTHPQTEIAWPWLASVIGGVLTIITITTWNFETFAFPLFYTIEMLMIYLLVEFKLGKVLSKV